MLDTGSSITTVRLAVVKRICRNRGGGTLPGIRGIDNKIVTVVDEIPLKICFKDARVSLENVAVVKMAPFPIILGVDWLVKANVNLVCKGNQIVPVFLNDLKENVENSLPCTTVPVEEEEAVPSEEFFEELAKELPPKRRKDAVRFSIKKAVEVPGESLRMLDGSIPFDFTGTGIVRFGFSAKPSRTWVVPSALVSFKNGRARVPLLNFDSNPVTVKRSNCLIFIDLDIGAQVAVVPLERKEAELSHRGGPARVSCAAVGMDRRAASRDDIYMGSNLSRTERERVFELLDRHSQCLPSERNQLGRAADIEHDIDTGNNRPITSRPYRISQFERRIVSEKVNEMLKDGVIQPSNSPWSSPVVLVKKKSGEHRFCVDYRRLNAVSKRDVYPLPRMDDVFDRLAGANYFSTLDLANGYWQVPVAEKDRQKTAFVTPDGLFEFNRMPFGLANAPATFQRLMDQVLKRLKWTACLVYLDDILVFGKSFEEHQCRLDLVLTALSKANLILNMKKCLFAANEVKHLGHIVRADGVRPDPEKVSALRRMEVSSLKSLRAFLGLASYYRKFIPEFAHLTAPLVMLLKKNARWKWEEEQKRAVRSLVGLLSSAPILAHFDESLPTEIHTDASHLGLGAVLAQKADGEVKPVAFLSRSLSEAEVKYHSNELECLALVWALKKFRCYLYGRPFIVRTDNSAVKWLWSKKELTGKFSRWILSLQEYDFKIEHVKGKNNVVADVLSRNLEPAGTSATEHRVSCVLKSDGYTAKELAYLQQIDKELRPITKRVLADKKDPDFAVRKGVVYKRSKSKTGRKLLLMVPSILRRDLISNCHDEPQASHLGVEKTLARVVENYWWPRMESSVRAYVLSCTHCQFHNVPPGAPVGLLNPIPPPARPFDTIGIDHQGPLLQTPSGNFHVLFAIDYLTKWVEAVPVPTTATSYVIKFLKEQIINRHGVPCRIITDPGSAFTSREFLTECEKRSIRHVCATAEHPQTNGLVERLNRTAARAIAGFIAPHHRDWDERLSDAVFAINTAKQSTTKYSPFQLVYGRLPNRPDNNMFEWPEDSPVSRKQFIKRVENLRKAARLNIVRRQKISKELADARRKASKPYLQGDLVLVRRMLKIKGLTKKFLPKYIGPFQVVKQVAETTYAVEDLPSRKKRKKGRKFNAHVVQMKPFRSRKDDEWYESEPDEPCVSVEDEGHGRGIAEDVVVPVEEPPPKSRPLVTTRSGRISRLPPILEEFELDI